MSLGEVGLEGERPLKTGHRLHGFPLVQEDGAEAIVRLGEDHALRAATIVLRRGLIEPALHRENVAKVVVRLGVVGLESQSPSNQVDRDIIAARLPGEHSEKMEAVDVLGINGTDLPVKAFSLDEIAGAVTRHRALERLGQSQLEVNPRHFRAPRRRQRLRAPHRPISWP